MFYLISLIWANLLQMSLLLVLMKMFVDTIKQVTVTFRISIAITLLLGLLNIAVFLVAILEEHKFGFCKKDYPNSLGGVATKFLTLVFNCYVFINGCCGWGLRDVQWSPELKELR